MTYIEPEEDLPPVAHVTLVYNGPVAPHWEMRVRYGDQKMLDDFWTRVHARLLLLPKHDPQFRRNRERVNRDAERELIICDWDLGEDDAESTSTPSAMAAPADQPAPVTAPVEAPPEAIAAEPTEVAEPTEAGEAGEPTGATDVPESAPVAPASDEQAPEAGVAGEPTEAAESVIESAEQPAGQS